MSTSKEYDFAVVGGGSAGYAAARTAVALGLKTVVLDGAKELGGLCILRGCMPSKALIESANRNLTIRHAATFGLKSEASLPDTAFIQKRKRELIQDFASYRQGQLQDGRFDLIRGHATLESDDDDGVTLLANLHNGSSQRIKTKSVLIATGSTIQIPDIPGLAEAGYLTSDSFLDLSEIPDSVIVLGGGAIALELAHYLEGIGRKVTIIQRSAQLLRGMDSDVAQVVQDAFIHRGMRVFTDTAIQRIEHTSTGKRVWFTHQGSTEPTFVEGAEILVALGRRPSTDQLGLERLSIHLTKQGQIAVSATQQTNHPRIFAAGDVCGPLEVVHIAIQQAEIAAKNANALLHDQPLREQIDYRCKLFGVFTQPQVAAVGLSEGEARARGVDFQVASYPFNDHGKSMVMNELDGFVKMLADTHTGKIIGASVVGPEATEIIHEVTTAMHFGSTVHQFAQVPHYHPTLSEIWTYPAEDLMDLVRPNFPA